MTCISLLLLGSVAYAASNVQGWVTNATPKAVVNASCNRNTSSQALKPGDVTINVYNSTAHTGLAVGVARLLGYQGFKIATIDNDPLSRTILGLGEIRHGPSGTAGAILAAARLPGAKLVLDDRMDASVDFVVGDGFRNLTTPPKATVFVAEKLKAHC